MRRFLVTVVATALVGFSLVTAAGASSDSSSLPQVSGGFGQTPKITFPSNAPPKTLASKVLHSGNGAKVKKGELLVANYVGDVWRGKTFDSSFSRAEPSSFPIGVGQVIPGWDQVLVGQRIGSRVLMVLPPSAGYGTTGNSQAGIKGTDTIVFVVDLIGAFSENTGSNPHSSSVTSSGNGVTVTGKNGSPPKVTVAKGTKQPSKILTTLIDKGSGPKVRPGLVVVQVLETDWTGKVVGSTWQTGTPLGVPVGDKSQPSLLDSIVGYPLGSRLLVLLPKSSQGGPYALDVDLAAEPHGTSSQLK